MITELESNRKPHLAAPLSGALLSVGMDVKSKQMKTQQQCYIPPSPHIQAPKNLPLQYTYKSLYKVPTSEWEAPHKTRNNGSGFL